MKVQDELSTKILNRWSELYSKNIGATMWDAFVDLVKDKSSIHMLYTKSDLPIIELIVSGLSASSISSLVFIPSSEIYATARTWGLAVQETTLDFNPLMVYNAGMTAMELMENVNDILPIEINIITATKIIHNIEKFHDIKKFLEDEDK